MVLAPVHTPPTQTAIRRRILELRQSPHPSGLDYESNELLLNLDYDHARDWLATETTERAWRELRHRWPSMVGLEHQALVLHMEHDLPGARGMVRRGPEMGLRVAQLYGAWTWLAGDAGLSDVLSDRCYAHGEPYAGGEQGDERGREWGAEHACSGEDAGRAEWDDTTLALVALYYGFAWPLWVGRAIR